MSWFDLTEPETETTKEYLSRIKYEKIVANSVNKLSEIVEVDLQEGIQYRFVTNNAFNAVSICDYILKNDEIEEMHIAIYRMNSKSVLFLKNVIAKNKIKTNILLSSFFRENKKYEKWTRDIVNYAKGYKLCKVGFFSNHAKVFIAKSKKGKHYVFEGSGKKIANILEVEINDIISDFNNPQSEFKKLYDQGADKADYVIDLKLFELAKTGDLNALEEFETRRDER